MAVNNINMYMFYTLVYIPIVSFIFQTNIVTNETFTDNI